MAAACTSSASPVTTSVVTGDPDAIVVAEARDVVLVAALSSSPPQALIANTVTNRAARVRANDEGDRVAMASW